MSSISDIAIRTSISRSSAIARTAVVTTSSISICRPGSPNEGCADRKKHRRFAPNALCTHIGRTIIRIIPGPTVEKTMTSREVAERTLEELQSKLGGLPSCPFCGGRSWHASHNVAMTGSIDPETNNVNPASGVPSIPLVCDNCGYTAFINPKKYGVM